MFPTHHCSAWPWKRDLRYMSSSRLYVIHLHVSIRPHLNSTSLERCGKIMSRTTRTTWEILSSFDLLTDQGRSWAGILAKRRPYSCWRVKLVEKGLADLVKIDNETFRGSVGIANSHVRIVVRSFRSFRLFRARQHDHFVSLMQYDIATVQALLIQARA